MISSGDGCRGGCLHRCGAGPEAAIAIVATVRVAVAGAARGDDGGVVGTRGVLLVIVDLVMVSLVLLLLLMKGRS